MMRLLIPLLVLTVSTLGLHRCQSLHPARVVWIELREAQHVEDLFALNLSLDVWEVGSRHVVVRTTDSVIHALRQQGYATVILYASDKEYLASVASGENPLRVAKVDCATIRQCQDLEKPGMVSSFIEGDDNYALVVVTGQQLVSLLESGYSAHLLCARVQECVDWPEKGEAQP
jgi:hypothetical protein